MSILKKRHISSLFIFSSSSTAKLFNAWLKSQAAFCRCFSSYTWGTLLYFQTLHRAGVSEFITYDPQFIAPVYRRLSGNFSSQEFQGCDVRLMVSLTAFSFGLLSHWRFISSQCGWYAIWRWKLQGRNAFWDLTEKRGGAGWLGGSRSMTPCSHWEI